MFPDRSIKASNGKGRMAKTLTTSFSTTCRAADDGETARREDNVDVVKAEGLLLRDGGVPFECGVVERETVPCAGAAGDGSVRCDVFFG